MTIGGGDEKSRLKFPWGFPTQIEAFWKAERLKESFLWHFGRGMTIKILCSAAGTTTTGRGYSENFCVRARNRTRGPERFAVAFAA